MNKRDKNKCVDERRHLYYNMLAYWQWILKKYQPDLIFFPDIPNVNYAYIIFALAKLLNIKTVILEDTWVNDRQIVYADFWRGSDSLHEKLRINKGKNFCLKHLSHDLQEYYRLNTCQSHEATTFYIKKQKKEFSKFNLFWRRLKFVFYSLKKGSIFKAVNKYITNHLGLSLKKEYVDLQTKFDSSRKFVYAPLHNQPERATSPQGDMFVDQILMIEILAASLPKDWIIYVKEHPAQWWLGGLSYSASRYPGYYERIAKIHNVYIVPIKTNTFTLIDKSQAVATVTGTAGWEAVLRSKSVVIFGYSWYRDCPDVFKVNSVESCKEVFSKVAAGFVPIQQDVINYLKSFDEATIHCNLIDDANNITKLTKEEYIDNVIEAILTSK